MSTLTTPQISTPTVPRSLLIVVGAAGLVIAGGAVAGHVVSSRTTTTTTGTVTTSAIPGSTHTGAQAEKHFFGPNAIAHENRVLAALNAQRGQEQAFYAQQLYQLGVPAYGGTGTLSVVGSPQFPIQMADYVRQLQQAARPGLAVVGSPQFVIQMADYVRQLQQAGRGSLAIVGSPQFAQQMSDYMRQLKAAATAGLVSDAVTEDVRRLHLSGAQSGTFEVADEQRLAHLRAVPAAVYAYGSTAKTDPSRDLGPRVDTVTFTRSTGTTDPARDLGPRGQLTGKTDPTRDIGPRGQSTSTGTLTLHRSGTVVRSGHPVVFGSPISTADRTHGAS